MRRPLSTSKAIRWTKPYRRIYEQKQFHQQIAVYRYVLTGLLIALCLSLLVYIRRRQKQVYKIFALQQQIEALENLRDIKDEVKAFILRDFEIAKKIATLRATQQVQSAKFLKDLEKHQIIKDNDLLATHWEQFYKHIDLSFDGFHSKLTQTYPALNEKEVQLCCMLLSGFKTEEIAAIWTNSVFLMQLSTQTRYKIDFDYLRNLKMNSVLGRKLCGGAYLVHKQRYLQCGGENEHFTGWGPEDTERLHRVTILGHSVCHIPLGELFHLYHPRGSNSFYLSKENAKYMREEFIRICCMSLDELKSYISK